MVSRSDEHRHRQASFSRAISTKKLVPDSKLGPRAKPRGSSATANKTTILTSLADLAISEKAGIDMMGDVELKCQRCGKAK